MTPEQIAIVQESFRRIEAIQETAARLFYERLWQVDPSTAPLFARSDMVLQGHKLMAALALVVNGLNRPEAVIPVVQDMARRHVAYGVTRAHYASVGAALVWTLAQGLGDSFTPEVRAAWTGAYELLSAIMIEAAYPG